MILEGAHYRGECARVGEIGHMGLQPDGPLCPCERRGCLESLASGRSLARRMAELRPGAQLSTREIAQATKTGDPAASQVWSEALLWLGIGIANAANLLDPGRVVVGG